jgi:hypothetical protein
LARDRLKTLNQIRGFLLEFSIYREVGHTVITYLCAALAEHGLTCQRSNSPVQQPWAERHAGKRGNQHAEE